MSTYLVAFVVGELEATDPVRVGAAPVRVWWVPSKLRLAAFGHAIAVASLRFFEEYYGLPYPGDKLDLLAIPDFAAGAMENLGAITFRETALLVDERAASHAEIERVADVVAHENAHMWFGDLVTMSWWNGIWLNEAFATFMEILAVDDWKPEWKRWVTFGVSRAAALVVDGLHSTRPVEYPVRAPRDADAMFDTLTYEKGASVLRMLEQYLGADVFRDGVRDYLRRHAYGNADTRDLWAALGTASRQPIPDVMDGWIFSPGYPLVSARVEGHELVLSQQRFAYLPEPPEGTEPSGEPGQRWRAPVQLRLHAGGTSSVTRLMLSGAEARLPAPERLDAVVVNEGGHGFYRVRYAPELLERLVRQLDDLAPIERFNLVNDTWAVTVAGLGSLTDYLDLTARFRGERDRNVWSVLLASFHALNRIVGPADRPRLAALLRDRVAPAFAALGWTTRPGHDAPGGAALPLRPRRLPAARADRADARAHAQRRDPDPGRAVRRSHAPHWRPFARADVGLRQDQLGGDGAPVPEARAPAPGRGCHRARHPRARARRPRVRPRAEDRLRRQDARAVPRAAPHRGHATRARGRGALEVPGALRLSSTLAWLAAAPVRFKGGSSMRRVMLGGVVAVTLAAAAAIAWAQHGHGSMGAEGHQVAQACATEFEKVVSDGRGFGLAFAADQNGYPGPIHVLELRDRLKLTADQAAKMQELMHTMFAESRPKGARLLEAEAKLRRLFADRTADEAAVRAAVAEVERVRSEVRLAHLLTHLKTRDLLTEEQRRIYHEARWGALPPAP